jgi:predicted enzyme related to lactoylglutathione lyase
MSEVPKGRHIWYDLMTPDTAGAIDFYGKVVGWTTTPFEGASEPYDMWTTENGPVGGVMTLPEEAKAQGAPPHWLAYIATPDVDATSARAKELGGEVLVPPQDIPTVGRFAVLQDLFGAVFAAFTPAGDAPGHDGRANPGEVSWHELYAENHEQAFDFYADLFGWEKSTQMDMGPMGIYQLVRRAGAEGDLGGMMNRPNEMPVSCWMYYFNVSDLDAAADTVKDNGGQVMHGPMVVPGGDRVCLCMDPQGAAFALHTYAAS